MKIIKSNPSNLGAYSPVQEGKFTICPTGYHIVPDNLDLTLFNEYNGFVTPVLDGNIVTNFLPNETSWNEWKSSLIDTMLESSKVEKIQLISNSCNEAIISGVDVTTTVGVEHFSLQETDQINLNAALQAVQQGAVAYPYHADKQLCRMFTAEEILAVVDAGTKHKVYHTTLCNHLLVWIRRCETIEELDSIIYSAENLPEDLATNMQAVLNTPLVTKEEVTATENEVGEN